MFVDEAKITVIGGHGGNGKVAYFPNRKGASGGNGGHGSNVYAVIDANITHLKKFIEISNYKGINGGHGGDNKKNGLNGDDLNIKMPINTTIIKDATSEEVTINLNNPKVLLCRGGIGGYGNHYFKSSTNRTPKHATKGKPGQQFIYHLILKLIANYGLIGLPNAGKSSLLNQLTKANVKIANYPFTTLEPNLGVYNGKIIADVPGLIEGASIGKGLGLKFLKHIEKVELLFHCISIESNDIISDYKTIIKELRNYNPQLLLKKSIILLTKTDLVDKTVVKKQSHLLNEFNQKILPISIYDELSLTQLKNIISPV